jgi:hypothetical protein
LAALQTVDAIDRRTQAFRRFASIRSAVVADLGGADRLSAIELQLIHRLAALCVLCEAMEASVLRGDDVDVDEFGRASGHARRLGETLGLQRRPKDITPDLQSYLASKRRRGADADDAEDAA